MILCLGVMSAAVNLVARVGTSASSPNDRQVAAATFAANVPTTVVGPVAVVNNQIYVSLSGMGTQVSLGIILGISCEGGYRGKMLQFDELKVQVLLSVLQRAPTTVAEQLVCEEVAALPVQLAEGQVAMLAPKGMLEPMGQPE